MKRPSLHSENPVPERSQTLCRKNTHVRIVRGAVLPQAGLIVIDVPRRVFEGFFKRFR